MQMDFQPVAVVSKLVQKIGNKHLYTKSETKHKAIQKDRIYKI